MIPSPHFPSIRRLAILASLLLLSNSCSNPPADAWRDGAQAAYVWTELGPDGIILARSVTFAAECPSIEVDGERRAMERRAATSPEGFEDVRVCEASVASGARSARVDGRPLALPGASIDRIVVVGDTGCRVLVDEVQNCSGVDPARNGPPWSFARVAGAIRDVDPDLIIHVGDYHYRESGTCDERCDQATVGYTWASWEADFFAPAEGLLAEAPWIFVRGNHEDCGESEQNARAWKGWFYLLDPGDLPTDPWAWASCRSYTEPYRVSMGGKTVLVMDSSEIPDDYASTPDSSAVARYADEFNTVDRLASGHSNALLVTHRPFWAVASYDAAAPKLARTDLTLQAAWEASDLERFPEALQMLLAGHIHQFEMLTFSDGRPPQFVFGGGATELDPPITDSLLSANAGILHEMGVAASDFISVHDIGFGVIERDRDQWNVSLRRGDGSEERRFRVE